MAQHDLDIANGSGAAVRADINGALGALGSTMKGPNAPPSPVAGMLWVEDDNPSSTRWTLRVYDGADWISLGIIDANTNDFEPANVLPTAGGAMTGNLYMNGASIRVSQNTTNTPGVGNTTTGGAWEHNADGSTLHISRVAYAAVRLNVNANDNVVEFFRSGSGVGNISVTTTATSYNTSSDYRLKDELEPIADAVQAVLATPVYRFRWKAAPDAPKVHGFVAHEAQATVPEAVTGTKDGPSMQGIDQSKMVPLLWAAVQELAQRVAALEAAQAAN